MSGTVLPLGKDDAGITLIDLGRCYIDQLLDRDGRTRMTTQVGVRPRRSVTRSCGHYTCLGIGVGPQTSASHGCCPPIGRYRTSLSKKDGFGWHDGQQMPRTSLQVALLVSLSDPTNAFSFLSY
jgi:L-lysine 6-monooxygenase/L-ornithine 5-monooxygenase